MIYLQPNSNMKAYLAIKFHEDYSNKILIEEIINSLKNIGIEAITLAKDYENWGETRFSPEELMELTFKLISQSDLLIVEFSEKGVGLGIEAGYAHAKGIPIIVIAKRDSEISDTLRGIAKEIIFYDKVGDLEKIDLE